ncbi:hypothetical protein [Sedimentibacter saalensis]|uniref:Uncharacterized protein n=1 Tax=Sedimentibacter saalensis TaxID=130788 RepID=A0A562JH33_9FIRM|nr:hypothetical protein [Sedimentibacter saalensis]TWH82566.1 hypothetical protein LY60_00867 [Sedimentibacter saalensis]
MVKNNEIEERFNNSDEALEDLIVEMKLKYDLLKKCNEIHKRFHYVEAISAVLTYNDIFSEKFRNEVDMIEFRKIINEDLNKLDGEPAIAMFREQITVEWFISENHILNKAKETEEIEIFLKDFINQFYKLTLCKIHELSARNYEEDEEDEED